MNTNNIQLLSLSILTCFSGKTMAQQHDQRPNILWIMSDDHSYQTISAYGSEISKLAPTPNIDRIANEGVRFDRAFVENSLSTPSRACLITGLYSHQNGQRRLGKGIDSTKTFVSQLLQEAGYRPYYMYRQKDTGHGLENTGFAKGDTGSIYNVAMMSDCRDVLSFGAGGMSKRCFKQEGELYKHRVERCPTIKDALTYIERVDEMVEKKIEFFSM